MTSILEVFTITELDQLKVLSHPFRQQILGAFCQSPATTMQVAESLGEKPHRLYHHVSLLETAGLITLVETRQNRGTIEKYYQAVAKSFAIDQSLLSVTDKKEEFASEMQTLLINAVEVCLNDARNHFEPHPEHTGDQHEAGLITQFRIRTSPEKRKILIKQLQDWVQAYADAADPKGEVEFSNLIAIFPVKDKA